MKTAQARANNKPGWTMVDDGKRLKFSELKVLLGLLFLVVGIVALVLGRLHNFPSHSAVFWIVAGLALLLNGFGIVPRRKP